MSQWSERFLCTDYEGAKRNREMVAKKLYVWAYVQVENWLEANPQGEVPEWVYTDGFMYSPVQAGRKGGLARAAKMTAEERSESARKAVNARIVKYNQKHLS